MNSSRDLLQFFCIAFDVIARDKNLFCELLPLFGIALDEIPRDTN